MGEQNRGNISEPSKKRAITSHEPRNAFFVHHKYIYKYLL
jgi:hypothetical protein